MKVAIWGVWHVHAKDYTKKAKEFGEVIGVYDDNAEWKNSFASSMEIPAFETAEDLLNSEAEGVIVCTATDAHPDVMIKIAERGKHIFTEKVLALTDEGAAKIADAVKANGVRFVISLPWKYSAPQIAVHEIVKSGELGNLANLNMED